MKTVTLAVLLVAFAAADAPGQEVPKTAVTSPSAKRMLLGRHMFSMQWVSWDRFGAATVTDDHGLLRLRGEQRLADDFVTIDGLITRVDAAEFGFRGTIVTRVSHINGGQPCTREGDFVFAIRANRKYWRLQAMDNPCEPVTDYVDVYFRRR